MSGPALRLRNVLTVDLEDWHALVLRRLTGRERSATEALRAQVDELLSLFAATRARATFFVVGKVAEEQPDLVRLIMGAGHEIGSHGYAHRRVEELGPRGFADDLRRSVEVLGDLTGQQPAGFRAPEFSIGRASLWALDALVESGFTYDSSIFPIAHPRYGIPGFPGTIGWARTPSGARILEMPLATFSLGRWRLPAAGGGYLRVLPESLISRAVRELNSAGEPAVIYVHPYDAWSQPLVLARDPAGDPDGASFPALRARAAELRYNLGRPGAANKLRRLFSRFPFGPAREVAERWTRGT